MQRADWKIAEYKVERKEERCPLPFSLTTLQIKASKLYRMSANTVLDICQSLYEVHKITSYPRSDCPYLPESQLADVPAVLRAITSFNGETADLVAAADAKHVSHAWDTKLAPIHHGIIPTTNANYASVGAREEDLFADLQTVPRAVLPRLHIHADLGSCSLQWP